MRRLLLALAAAILAWIGVSGVAMAAVATPDSPVQAYTYDTSFHAVPGDDSASERGAPATRDPMRAFDAVDRPSHGVSTRFDGSIPRPATRYARAATLVQVARTISTTSHHAWATSEDLSSPRRFGVAAKGGDDTVSLFRAVSKAEADDIAGNGFRQAPSGLSYEGKLFATSADDAARYGRINYGQDGVPFHIVETRVPPSFADQLYTGTADRMTFRAVDPDQLAGLNRLGSTSIWNHVPWVAKP